MVSPLSDVQGKYPLPVHCRAMSSLLTPYILYAVVVLNLDSSCLLFVRDLFVPPSICSRIRIVVGF
jgi:hypothetical protein